MLILADENIMGAEEVFSQFGAVKTFAGRELRGEELRSRGRYAGAEVLMVRSVTQVNSDLLDETNIRFVGTATIGRDHINEVYLAERGIAFSDAAGCNSEAVVQWTLAALFEAWPTLREGTAAELSLPTLGIIGCGRIGSRIAECAKAIGFPVLVNDPPLEAAGGAPPNARKWSSLDEVLAGADAITLHVPMIRDGEWPTLHLFDAARLKQWRVARPESPRVVLNASRGKVIDNGALLNKLKHSDSKQIACLDVFEDEPAPSNELIEHLEIATPHIAGYSLEGKQRGTTMLAEALHEFLEKPDEINIPPSFQNQPVVLEVVEQQTRLATIAATIKASYPIRDDDRNLRAAFEGLADDQPEKKSHAFDTLRRTYAHRRELPDNFLK